MASPQFDTVAVASSFPNDTNNDSHVRKELWYACAGSVSGVPKRGQRVYYFPQGHIEQLQGTAKPQHDEQLPFFKVPSKILCSVTSVSRKIEHGTDEVYVELTLQVEKEQTEVTDPMPEPPDSPRPTTVHSFSKILTTSDTSTHGTFLVRKINATECLPQLDISQPTPSQQLVTKDLYGNEWRFKHIFRGQPRRHLLTTGWSTFVASKKLGPGDKFVFMRGDNDELMVGVRRRASQQPPFESSLLSAQSMSIAVLGTAYNAITGMNLFTVHYKPRGSPFIVGVNKYLESLPHRYEKGMRIKMNVDGEDDWGFFTGTIVEVGDSSPHWPGSQWRSLKVQWDGPSGRIQRPDWVSPWEVEPYVALPFQSVPPTINKRLKSTDVPPASDARTDLASTSGTAQLQHKDKQKMNENPTNFRLFGIDLANASVVLPRKQPLECPTSDCPAK